MCLRLVFAWLLLGLVAANAEPFSVMGVGAWTCGQFAEQYRKAPDGTEDIYFAWAQGFMGGLNVARLTGHEAPRDLNGKSASEQRAFLRSYCDEHPLNKYWLAAGALYGTFPVFTPPKN